MGWRAAQDHEHRMDNVILRGYLVQDLDTSGTVARAKFRGTNGTMNEGLDYIQPAGIVSNPGSGKKVEAIAVEPNGDSSQRVIIAVAADRTNAPKAAPGETIIYSPTDKNIKMKISKDGGVQVSAPGKSVTVDDAEEVNFLGIFSVNKATGKTTMTNVEMQTLTVTGQSTLGNTTINGVPQVGN
jgi:phage gp45-like